jgi:hypothetical protein
MKDLLERNMHHLQRRNEYCSLGNTFLEIAQEVADSYADTLVVGLEVVVVDSESAERLERQVVRNQRTVSVDGSVGRLERQVVRNQ